MSLSQVTALCSKLGRCLDFAVSLDVPSTAFPRRCNRQNLLSDITSSISNHNLQFPRATRLDTSAIMPFFRHHSKKSKYLERSDMTDHAPSRPGTAHGFSIAPRVPPAPGRNNFPTPASFVYDNGTGMLDPQLLQAEGLPMHFKTTDQLAEFIRNRDSSSGSSSHYSTNSSVYSQAQPYAPRTFSVQSNPYHLPRPASHSVRAMTNPMVTGISRRYVVQPVVHMLPGATKKHEFEGYWLRRGTLRQVSGEGGKNRKDRRQKAKGEAEQDRSYVETSGWYDD